MHTVQHSDYYYVKSPTKKLIICSHKEASVATSVTVATAELNSVNGTEAVTCELLISSVTCVLMITSTEVGTVIDSQLVSVSCCVDVTRLQNEWGTAHTEQY